MPALRMQYRFGKYPANHAPARCMASNMTNWQMVSVSVSTDHVGWPMQSGINWGMCLVARVFACVGDIVETVSRQGMLTIQWLGRSYNK